MWPVSVQRQDSCGETFGGCELLFSFVSRWKSGGQQMSQCSHGKKKGVGFVWSPRCRWEWANTGNVGLPENVSHLFLSHWEQQASLCEVHTLCRKYWTTGTLCQGCPWDNLSLCSPKPAGTARRRFHMLTLAPVCSKHVMMWSLLSFNSRRSGHIVTRDLVIFSLTLIT